ncbi:MAG: SDR family oxidoreductase [Candidatus Binataceae bacterium]|nr:SDR family oxidoreductase [Candidatus Binataceae bacterium]
MAILNGKRALVIGAGSGIGQATARLFHNEGARVACADLNRAAAQATAAELGAAPCFQLDIADHQQVHRTVDSAAKALGGLDLMVSTPFGPVSFVIENLPPEQWQREFNVLASGTLYAFQAAIPWLRKAGGGVLLSATASLFGDYGAHTHPAIFPAYSAAKAAQEMIIKATAMLHSREGIRSCGVQPGFTRTEGAVRTLEENGIQVDQFEARIGEGMPMGMAMPEAVAEGFLFLASDYASYITGYTLLVDGGSYAGRFGRMLY